MFKGRNKVCIESRSIKIWPVNSIDVKAIFLQGKNLEMNVFARPPKEAQTNKIWKLNSCVYGYVLMLLDTGT